MYNNMIQCISEYAAGDIYVHSIVYKHSKKNFPLCLVGGNSDTIIFQLEDNIFKQCVVQGIARLSCHTQLS